MYMATAGGVGYEEWVTAVHVGSGEILGLMTGYEDGCVGKPWLSGPLLAG